MNIEFLVEITKKQNRPEVQPPRLEGSLTLQSTRNPRSFGKPPIAWNFQVEGDRVTFKKGPLFTTDPPERWDFFATRRGGRYISKEKGTVVQLLLDHVLKFQDMMISLSSSPEFDGIKKPTLRLKAEFVVPAILPAGDHPELDELVMIYLGVD